MNAAAQLCFLIGIIIIWYASDYYIAGDEAKECLNGTETADFGLLFDGSGTESALVFYPGGKVEYTAYAPLMLTLAEDGIDCFLCEMPYNLAVFGINTAQKAMNSYSYDKWYVGGHSLGGAMAAVYAENRSDISGFVLLGAYPTSAPNCPALMVYGTCDGVVNRQKLEKGLAMENVTGFVIEGGNHAGFGCYGAQAGDGEAELSSEEQWDITEKAVREFIL